MKVLDLFSGIGGFSVGLEAAGMETIAFCEFDKHARAVLKKHWTDVPIHNDVSELDGRQYRGTVDVVCGGFPCQDLSIAGKQAGFEGERSSLYTEMLRIISECRPKYAIFENVTALLTGDRGRWFAKFLYDLEQVGYNAEWHCISASELGAYHHRDRVWIIAYPKSIDDGVSDKKQIKRQKSKLRNSTSKIEVFTNPNSKRLKRESKKQVRGQLNVSGELMRSIEALRGGFNLSEPGLHRANDGVRGRSHRLKQLGNAVVPVIPQAIGMAIMAVESRKGGEA